MNEYRYAAKEDLATLKTLWALTFNDPKPFIDFYFANRFNPENTLLLIREQQITSMLTKIPVGLVTPEGKFDGAMFYAIATHPQFQKQGLATFLIEFANQGLVEAKKDFSVVVPANRGLFGFYLRQGYRESFSIVQRIIKAEELQGVAFSKGMDLSLEPIAPKLYNSTRQEFLKEQSFIDYPEEEVAQQQKLSRFSGADLYSIKPGPGGEISGLMIVERISKERVIIKECLAAEEFLLPAVKELAGSLPAKEYFLRVPNFSGSPLKESPTPFAVIKNLGQEELLSNRRAYLGLAFD
ncbi:MAG: GNAT family N-acetyltransferase [Bacillota bacterium]